MGWMETCAVDERMRFVMAIERQDEAFAAVCRRFKVSRKTGYKWLERYRGGGRCGPGRSLAGAAASSASGGAEIAEHCLGGAAGASDLGPREGAGMAGAARTADGLAGGEHDRDAVRSRGFDGEASAAAA